MSFPTVCRGCGSLSGPSVGVCPFCKTIMANKKTAAEGSGATTDFLRKLYVEGRLDQATLTAHRAYRGDEKARKDADFLLMYAKVLIDTEGPGTLIRGVLAEAAIQAPENSEIQDYNELMAARQLLRKGVNDEGEQRMKAVLRRAPQNFHAHFFLGTHLFWVDEQPALALSHLETCARISPKFLRVWGCLGAIYKKLGHKPLADAAFRKCIELETDETMLAYFKTQIA